MKRGLHTNCRHPISSGNKSKDTLPQCCVRGDLIPTISEIANWTSGRVACGTLPPLGGLHALVPSICSVETAAPGSAMISSATSLSQAHAETRIAEIKGCAGIIGMFNLAVQDGSWRIQIPDINKAATCIVSTYLTQSRARTILVKSRAGTSSSEARLVAQRIRGILRGCGAEVSHVIRWSYMARPNGKKNPQSTPWCILTTDSFPCLPAAWHEQCDVVVELPTQMTATDPIRLGGDSLADMAGILPRIGGALVAPNGAYGLSSPFDCIAYGTENGHVRCAETPSRGSVHFGGEAWSFDLIPEHDSDALLWGCALAAAIVVVPCTRRIARSAQMQWEQETNGLLLRAA